MALLVASSSARPLGGGSGGVVSGESILQLLRRVYLQQLGICHRPMHSDFDPAN
uniref:Uncharacterized protein n=1 Tax=Oryza sativa subsp. japonica TaxID=39947 RepID=Q654Q0_ORYSJ|nr:hypothetical protein [Oryza sativa Japonica Group]